MNNQLIRQEDVSVFDKIKAFFKGLFSKKGTATVEVKEERKQIVQEETPVKENREKSDFIRTIEQHPERIDSLSDDILDRLIRYYRKITSSKKARIKELKGN